MYKMLTDGNKLLIIDDAGSNYKSVQMLNNTFVLNEYSLTQKSLINSKEFKTVAEVSNNFPENISKSISKFFS